MVPPRRIFYALLVLMLLPAGLAHAGNDTTQAGNITAMSVLMPYDNASWHAVVGALSPSPQAPFSVNATPGNLTVAVINSSSGSLPYGVNGSIWLLFSNSSEPITSLSPGNLTLLDGFINMTFENASGTFTTTTTFSIGNFTIAGVPTAYTNAPNATSFRMGYLQDQSGNIVIAVQSANQTPGFNGSLFDFQLMLPTMNGTAVEYYVTVIVSGNIQPPIPPQPPSPSPSPHPSIPSNVSLMPQPPPIVLPPANAWLLVYPILKEMSPGDSAFIFPLLENPGPYAIYADAVPAGSSAALASAVRGVLLLPNKPTTIVIPVQVPQDVPAGYYALTIEYSLNGSYVSQPLIIHVVPSRAAGLAVYREVSIDQQQNNSVMRLHAVNKGDWPIGHAEVFEQVPPAFDLQGLSFIVPHADTDKSLITWDLINVLSNETRMLSYVLPGIPDNLELFTLWPAAQTLIIEPDSYRHILITGFEAPDIGPGEKGNYVLKLFNAGSSDETVAVRITGADGWGLEPDSFNLFIHSRATSDLTFSLTAPADAPDPVYTLTVYLEYAGIRDQKTLPVPLNHERLVATAPPPLAQQLVAWVARNVSMLVLAVLACVAVSLVIRLGYLEIKKPKYSRKRVDALLKLQQMFGDDENKK